jgi:hypothetical protein
MIVKKFNSLSSIIKAAIATVAVFALIALIMVLAVITHGLFLLALVVGAFVCVVLWFFYTAYEEGWL